MNKSKKGFTLIELIVVLAILAVIAAIAVPTAFGSIEKARVAADKASVDSFNSAINYQAALIMTDSSGNLEAPNDAVPHNSVKGAFLSGGLTSGKYKAQSDGLYVKWNIPTGSASGYFDVKSVVTNGYTQIAKNSDIFDGLVKISKDATGSTGSDNGDEIIDVA